MKAILMSIQSKWLAKILNGDKTVELRKRFPKDYRGWVYLYCTKSRPFLADFGDCEYPYKSGGIEYTNDTKSIIGHDAEILNGKVVCRFWVDKVDTIIRSGMGYYVEGQDRAYTNRLANQSSLTFYDLQERFGDNPSKAIHISKVEIFDKPKELGEFSVERYAEMPNGVFPCYEPLTKAPQSWQYIYIEEETL